MNELYNKIYELETYLIKPEIRSSVETLNNLLADDFREFGSSGLIYNKQDILNRLPAETNKTEYIVSNFEIKILSEDVVMTNFKTEKAINDTEKFSSLRTSLWKKEKGEWKMFFHQGTLIK
jgi:hypothetical protein